MKVIEREVGNDPTFAMMIAMFSGNLLSIPEDELRANLQRYLDMMNAVLNAGQKEVAS